MQKLHVLQVWQVESTSLAAMAGALGFLFISVLLCALQVSALLLGHSELNVHLQETGRELSQADSVLKLTKQLLDVDQELYAVKEGVSNVMAAALEATLLLTKLAEKKALR